MTQVTEVAPDVFRISTYVPPIDLQFNQFLVRDEQPLLYHTGLRGMFDEVREAVGRLIDPATLRWIGFSHFEADECGALREWQTVAPRVEAVCSLVAKSVSVDDMVALRPARALADNEAFETGQYRFRFLQTPQVPHAWDAGHLFEETNGTLFCSDLFHQTGDVEPQTGSGAVLERFEQTLRAYQGTPFADYLPFTTHTAATLNRLAALRPRTLAAMHGATYVGDGQKAITELARVLREVMEA